MKAIRKSASYYDKGYFLLPEKFTGLKDFIEFLNDNPNRFIELIKLSEKSAAPYFIEEDCKTVYRRFNDINELEEIDIELLPRAEYTKLLVETVKKVCVNCQSYHDSSKEKGEIGNLNGHWANINLNGECPSFSDKNKKNSCSPSYNYED